MVHYRKFRNTDPPALVEVWNEVFTGRGVVRLSNSTPLERLVFAKPYFDPAGLILAEENGVCAGFAHAGFGAAGNGSALGHEAGVVCVCGVRPAYRRRGIGSQLLEHCETYLRERGAATLYAGPHRPRDPFYLGLYGGSELPGFLASQADAQPFLGRHQYQVCQEIQVLQRRVLEPLKRIDPRLASYRQQYELGVNPCHSFSSWWQASVMSGVEAVEFFLADRAGGRVARALVWEMEGFAGNRNLPAVGIVDLEVQEGRRRQGLGRFFVGQILRTLQEQYFEIVEIQLEQTNTTGMQFCQGLGFSQVDIGRVYKKEV